MIREAKPADLPQFLELTARFRASTKTYPNCPIDTQSIVHVLGRCMSSAIHLALVAEHDGRLTGALLAITQDLWWSNAREATDAMIYAETPGDGYRMARRYIRWAWRQPKVQVVTLAHSGGGDLREAERFHRILGMTQIGLLSQLTREEAGA